MPNAALAKIAQETLAAVANGQFVDENGTHTIADLSKSPSATSYHPPDSTLLTGWAASPAPPRGPVQTQLLVCKASTLEGVQQLCASGLGRKKIGVLNFASATRPGGGFLAGARAQEESIARSSNLYSSLMTPAAQRFYALHKQSKEKEKCYYTHAMVYTRGVQIFRSDAGEWHAPTAVDVLTSAAVNAGVVRGRSESNNAGSIKAYFKPVHGGGHAPPVDVERQIEKVMRERMARVLYLFEQEGAQDLVLGSFGTGVFQNKVPMVAKLWAELLGVRFKNSFERVVFAIIDEKTCKVFREVFEERQVEG